LRPCTTKTVFPRRGIFFRRVDREGLRWDDEFSRDATLV
jgi:hypothetical protein